MTRNASTRGVEAVRDPDGRPVLATGHENGSIRVRDPATGREKTVPADEVDRLDRSPLDLVRDAVTDDAPPPVGSDDRAVGLAVELADCGPTPVRQIVTRYEACESALNGMLAELRVAGVIEATTVAGVAAYRPTPAADRLAARLRE